MGLVPQNVYIMHIKWLAAVCVCVVYSSLYSNGAVVHFDITSIWICLILNIHKTVYMFVCALMFMYVVVECIELYLSLTVSTFRFG